MADNRFEDLGIYKAVMIGLSAARFLAMRPTPVLRYSYWVRRTRAYFHREDVDLSFTDPDFAGRLIPAI